MINYCPTTIEIVGGETRLLTEVDSHLRLNRAVLTPEFYDLLKQRYELVRLLWRHANNEADWVQELARDDKLIGALHDRMTSAFGFREAVI